MSKESLVRSKSKEKRKCKCTLRCGHEEPRRTKYPKIYSDRKRDELKYRSKKKNYFTGTKSTVLKRGFKIVVFPVSSVSVTLTISPWVPSIQNYSKIEISRQWRSSWWRSVYSLPLSECVVLSFQKCDKFKKIFVYFFVFIVLLYEFLSTGSFKTVEEISL